MTESTAQYWKPIWLDLEPHFSQLHLAQAHSNRAPKGASAILRMPSDSPGGCWPTSDPELRDRVRLQNQLEALLEVNADQVIQCASELLD